jgi:hypothetical protein
MILGTDKNKARKAKTKAKSEITKELKAMRKAAKFV